MKYFIQILIISLLFSCSKTKNKEYYNSPFEIEFEANQGIQVRTQNKVSINIPPNCFVDQSGKKYKGKVKFKLIEVLTKKEMINLNLSTSSNDKILISGGMFFLSAQNENGENLSISDSESIGLCAQLGISMREYNRFYGVQGEADINWVEPNQMDLVEDNSRGNVDFYHEEDCLDAYVFDIKKLGWINIDKLEEGDMRGNIVLTTKEKDLNVKLVFRDINSVLNCGSQENTFKLENLPLDRKVTIIAYKEAGSNINYYQKETTIDTMQNFEIMLAKITAQDFKDKISKL